MTMARMPARLIVFFAASALVLVWIGADLLARRVSIPSELQYVPQNYDVIFAAGGPRRLWDAVDAHFGDLIRTDPYKGGFYTSIRRRAEDLKKKGIVVATADDLEALGLDNRRGVIVTTYSSGAMLAVASANDVSRLLQTIAALGKDDVEESDTAGVRKIGKYYVANPAGRIVVLSTDSGLLDTALATRSVNRQAAFASDALFEPIAEQLRGPMLTGSSFFISMPAPPSPLLRRISAVISLDEAITVDAAVEAQNTPFRAFEALMKRPPPPLPWADVLAGDTAATVTIRDWAIPLYVDALSRAGILTAIDQRYAGVLGELRSLPSLRQTTLAAAGFHNGLPDLLFGVWADPAAVDAMITKIQTRARLRRDQAILRGAIAVGQQPSDEPGGFFERYPLSGGKVGTIPLATADFANDRYQRTINGATIRFLLPPITDNDKKFRPEIQAVIDASELMSDRYRLAVARVGDAYWFATDATMLERPLRRDTSRPSLEQHALFDATRRTWTDADRVQLFANLDRVIEAGALSPESGISEAIRKYLFDLREHPAVSLTAATADGPPRLRLIIRLARR
jgi:hypothetical protein